MERLLCFNYMRQSSIRSCWKSWQTSHPVLGTLFTNKSNSGENIFIPAQWQYEKEFCKDPKGGIKNSCFTWAARHTQTHSVGKEGEGEPSASSLPGLFQAHTEQFSRAELTHNEWVVMPSKSDSPTKLSGITCSLLLGVWLLQVNLITKKWKVGRPNLFGVRARPGDSTC